VGNRLIVPEDMFPFPVFYQVTVFIKPGKLRRSQFFEVGQSALLGIHSGKQSGGVIPYKIRQKKVISELCITFSMRYANILYFCEVIFRGQTLEMKIYMEKGKQILIIDDSNTALLLMEYALKEAGFGAVVASSVKEGMAEISRKKPDLILLDLSMPDMSGYDFLKMKESLNIEDVPVIVVSAYDSAESIEMTRQLGAADFIAKPIRLDALMERIHAILSR